MDRRSETRRPYISIMPSLNCQDGCVCQHSGEHKRLNNVQEETSSPAGQEAGKPALPKPVGGIMDRRSETRRPYISIMPSLNCQDGCVCQHSGEHKRLNNVQEETSSRSRPLVQLPSCLWDEILLKNIATGEPVCQTNLSRILETSTLPVSLASYEVEGNQITGNIQNPDKNSEHVTEHASGVSNDLNGHNGIAFVNIDSYEPDSSDGEDDDGQDQVCLGREGAGVFQEALDDVVSELGKTIEAFTDLESQLSTLSCRISRECCKEVRPVPLTRYLSTDSDMNHSNNKTLKKSPTEDQAIPKSNVTGDSHETQQINLVDTEICTPVTTYNELNLSDDEAEQGNPPELVVRPKIKQNPRSRLERETHLSGDDEESKSTSNRGSETAKIQQGYDKRTWRNDNEELSFAMFLKSEEYTDSQKNTSTDLRRDTTAQEQNDDLNDSNFWDALECCSRHLPQPLKDEDSSECSDGEWSASGPFCFAAAAKSVSDESWGTLPGREEREPEEVEVYIGSGLGGRELPPLEEVEFPFLQYPEESSSDEENHLVSEFVHPGLFILDGNNNLEDDSSVSEDLDVEWRLLDEFNEGLGVAQAISSVDPQFITYVALEERLAQAMENALAHLESLAVDDQQAHPPAPKESIDCLPQIIITDDRNGQDQCCCTICFSEYVKDEIITELPCHHLFHKLCVTLWLQKSGTCPICRHVLAPVDP
nr:E3 ubiquitin-protein ligase Praja-2 isoform X3 [Anas platyrhynchos]XP_027302372.2 E3 ubiquitin-protein ligase Praja-2 isoform X3 [Anas platyrhynchos]XP_038026834.1 E3 ubiquitin-protein ligase Praja-2 isoform X3 [Anas platyrhynchos]